MFEGPDPYNWAGEFEDSWSWVKGKTPKDSVPGDRKLRVTGMFLEFPFWTTMSPEGPESVNGTGKLALT